MVKVKICGIRSEAGALACAEAKVDLVGLNFVPTSRRVVSLEQAQAFKSLLPGISLVGVFAVEKAPFSGRQLQLIAKTVEAVELEWAQIHGDVSPALGQSLAQYCKIIKAIAVDDRFDPQSLEPYRPWVTAFLFDAPQPGSGQPFNWQRLAAIPRDRLFFLAGGLTPENVADAIAQVQPDGVDTASGIETNGVEDPARILSFCLKVRSCKEINVSHRG